MVFIALCQSLLIFLDLFCNLLYPAYETLFYLAKFRRNETYNAQFTIWTTYWIFYSVLYAASKLLYFFPFAYEIRVIVILLMAHPKVEATSKIQRFFVTNPLLLIKLIDMRIRLKQRFDDDWIPALKSFSLIKK